jgi:hypothetical protein
MAADIRKRKVFKMKNTWFAVSGFLLVLGFVLAGCDSGTDDDGGGDTNDIGNYTGIYTGDFKKSDYTSAASAEITVEEFIINGEYYSGTKVSGGASQSGVQYAGQRFTMTWAYLEVENEKAGVITSYGNQKHELFLGYNSGLSFIVAMDVLDYKNERPDWGLITWNKWEGEGEKDN